MDTIATFENAKYGIRSEVCKVSDGYSVSLLDTDAGEYLPEVLIYKDLESAVRKARQVVE